MKQIILICCIITWAFSSFAQEFNTHWISYPEPDSTSHIWFRKSYLQQGRPQEGHITIASTGYYKLYINEYNVGTAVFYPFRAPYSDDVVVMSFDVTPYLRNDTNVVAVIYSPTYPHVNPKQVSIIYHGRGNDGQPFSYTSNADWLCRKANSALNGRGGETIDGRYHNPDWRSTNFYQALWRNVREQRTGQASPITLYNHFYPALKINRRRGYHYFDLLSEGVEYEFGEGIHGWLRLTLRNARKGQTIRFGNSEYICNGKLDEQACPVFSISDYRRIYISGSKSFQRDQIVDIEAIGIAPAILSDY